MFVLKASIAVVALLGISRAVGEQHLPQDGKQESSRKDNELIVAAIRDEIAAAHGYKADEIRADDYSQHFYALAQPILIEPTSSKATTITTHVVYPLADAGWVLREVTIFRSEGLAAFELGYSVGGPGLNTGFLCTHTLANCRLQDVEFPFVRRAFAEWAAAEYSIFPWISSPTDMADAGGRNNRRFRLLNPE